MFYRGIFHLRFITNYTLLLGLSIRSVLLKTLILILSRLFLFVAKCFYSRVLITI